MFPVPIFYLILKWYSFALFKKSVCWAQRKESFYSVWIYSWEYSCLLFIFAKEGREPNHQQITFMLMGKGVMGFTYFSPLLNEKHVCQKLRREIWIYFEKINHADSFTLTYLQRFAAHLNSEGEKWIPEC